MLDNKTMGIKIPELKTFFYIEVGDNWIGNPIDRIKKTLIQRNVLKADLTGSITNYTICSYGSLKENNSNYTVEAIYLSKHIEALHKANNNGKQDSGLFKS